MESIHDMIARMDPEDAMNTLTAAAKSLFPHVGEKARLAFICAVTEGGVSDTAPDLVHR